MISTILIFCMCMQGFNNQICAKMRSWCVIPPIPWAAWSMLRSHSVTAKVDLLHGSAPALQTASKTVRSQALAWCRQSGAVLYQCTLAMLHACQFSYGIFCRLFRQRRERHRQTEDLDVHSWHSLADLEIGPTGRYLPRGQPSRRKLKSHCII